MPKWEIKTTKPHSLAAGPWISADATPERRATTRR